MNAIKILLGRYLFPQIHSLMGLALWISIAGVALGIVQLMVVLSVMTGFQDLFRTNYTRISSDLVVIPMHGSYPEIERKLNQTRGIEATTPILIAQSMLLGKQSIGGTVLEGIEVASARKVTDWQSIWLAPPRWDLQEKDPHWIWLGVQLAKKLKVEVGETVQMLIADGDKKRSVPFRVTALTRFGIYEHDLRYARVGMGVVKEFFPHIDLEPLIKCRISAGLDVDVVADHLRATLEGRARIRTWKEVHQNVFLAVEHQKGLLFAILELIIGLAAMNLVNLLMMSSYQRRKDIAILRAMGMPLKSIWLFFTIQGTVVGLVGIAVGVVLGRIVCWLIDWFQPSLLSESVYNVTRLPIHVAGSDVLWISVVALFLCILFSLAPSFKAALQRPVEALRND